MLSIGAFAGLGQVSVRMLRHWDAVGLLVPAHVDEWTGYRSYSADQLDRLNRVVALRDLGFGLDDVRTLLDDGVGAERLAALLHERRTTVAAEHAVAVARLAEVQRRLHAIEKEHHMSDPEIVLKSLPAVRLAGRGVHVDDPSQIAGVLEPIFGQTAEALTREGGAGGLEVPIAQYAWAEDGLDLVAGYEYGGPPADGFEILDLPAAAQAACLVHLGAMSGIQQTWQALMEGIEARGLQPSAPGRERYVRAEGEDQSDWVTEIQQPVSRA